MGCDCDDGCADLDAAPDADLDGLPDGCYNTWYCVGGEGDEENEYYCDGSENGAPCSFAYHSCTTEGDHSTCQYTLGEVSGGTCADMVGPYGTEHPHGEWFCDCDDDVCAELDAAACGYQTWYCVGGEDDDENDYYCDGSENG